MEMKLIADLYTKRLTVFVWLNYIQISLQQNKFSSKYKILPVNLTWLHHMYEKMFILAKPPDVLVFVCL